MTGAPRSDDRTDLDAALTSEAFLEDPYPIYRRLRDEAPVYRSRAWGGWLVTRHDDVLTLLRDQDRFSSRGGFASLLDQLPAAERSEFAGLYRHFSTGLTRSDPPDHTRIRTIVSKVFTPRSIATLEARIVAIANDLVDRFEDREQADLVREFAYPLPASVIFEVVGFPLEARDQVKDWSDTIIRMHGTGVPDREVLRGSQAALEAAREWLGQLIEARRADPRDDLLSRLIEADEQGDRLSGDELFTNSILFLVGGHETTTNLIASGLNTLLMFPDQWDRLTSDETLWRSAVEELLRWEAPLQRVWRIARADVTLRGSTIRVGEPVNLMLGAANRDPGVFERPDIVDLGRADNPHLSFGMGIHFCLGAALARLEARVAISTLMGRLPALQRVSGTQPQWVRNGRFRGLVDLPVTF